MRHRDKWRIRWTDEQGERHSESHVSYKDAELALGRHRVEAEERRRGRRKLAPGVHTLAELWEHWSTHHGKQKRSRETDESIYKFHLEPAFGTWRLDHIDAQAIALFKLDPKRACVSHNTVNHHLSLLITMLRYAVEIAWLQDAPNIKKYRVRPPTFTYLRSTDEVRRFLTAAKEETPEIFALYLTALHTGLRAGEIAGLRWSDVDLAQRIITVEHSYTGPTKGGEIRHVPIDDVLLPSLREHRLRRTTELVFPSSVGEMLRRDSRPLKQTLRRVLERARFDPSYITFHDLRHTFASHWMLNRGDVFKLQKILGHKNIKTTMRYAHLAPDAFADDLDRLASLAPVEHRAVLTLDAARPQEQTEPSRSRHT